MHSYIRSYKAHYPSKYQDKFVPGFSDGSVRFGMLEIDTDSPYYPKRSDLKIMRSDIVASIIATQELCDERGFSKEELEKMPIFMANGAFVDDPEKHLRRMPTIFNTFTEEMDSDEKRNKLYKMSPPLLALETLTNSSMSFISQYIGLKGQNATFGNTSAAGLSVLETANVELNLRGENNILTCAVNCGNTYSILSNKGVKPKALNWKESAGVGILELSKQKDQAICRITHIENDSRIPSLNDHDISRNWESMIIASDLIIFSGAYSDAENKEDQEYLNGINTELISLYEAYGNLGAANIFLGIITGIDHFSDTVKTVTILDRDVFGRESMTRIEKV